MFNLLEFLGFYHCNLCGKKEFKFKGKVFNYSSYGIEKYLYVCSNCMKFIGED